LSTHYVLIRVLLRLVILGGFAAFGSQGFAKTFGALSMIAAIYCALIGALRREPISWHVLTHWDEAVMYALLGYAVVALA
jgi:hypothetical protein